MGQQVLALPLGEATLGADQHVSAATPRSGPQGLNRIGAVGVLVAKNQQAMAIPARQKACQRQWLRDRGEVQDAALLGGFNDVGTHPLGVRAADLSVLRDHRTEG